MSQRKQKPNAPPFPPLLLHLFWKKGRKKKKKKKKLSVCFLHVPICLVVAVVARLPITAVVEESRRESRPFTWNLIKPSCWFRLCMPPCVTLDGRKLLRFHGKSPPETPPHAIRPRPILCRRVDINLIRPIYQDVNQ